MVVRVPPPSTRVAEFWEARFRLSLENPPEIPCDSARLTEGERRTIRASIQEFQLGERSEGRHLQRAARDYAQRSGDAAYCRAVELFIREEQHHAAWLGRFMDLACIAQLRHTWVDSVFRRLRRFAGLETSICVLLTAEVIAKIYYRGLFAATESAVLRTICRRILEDEAGHVEFQSERVAILRRQRARSAIAVAVAAQRLLFAAAVGVVWLRHKPVLGAHNDSFLACWRECQREFRASLVLMDPAHYAE
jgi:hypothetical protein